MKVPFFPYKKIFQPYKEDFINVLNNIIDDGQFILGDELENFEKNISKFISNKYCVGVGNATDALEMIISYLNFDNRSEIILSAHTMIATLSAITQNNLIPVPVDINMDGTINLESIKINTTQNTKAIIISQINGHTHNMDNILNYCKEKNIVLIEDSAQGIGSKFNGINAGCFGIAGCLSFYPAKVLGSLGDGGAIITNNKDLYQWALLNRDHGRTSQNTIQHIGRNSRLDNLMAGFLNVQLFHLKTTINRRLEIAKLYTKRLSEISHIVLPSLYENDNKHEETFQNFEVLALHRNELKKFLYTAGIGTIIQWGGISINKIIRYKDNDKLKFKNTNDYFDRCLLLPINTSITNNEINFVCDKIIDFYK